ncbi:MAG: hypothetical protein DI598_06280 [Pseudopedobacter saltans]|uniref:DUF2480 domain-containing protein n=1 Tax=Pseudopedobacter saltans TaxID=151895 RepID=A0A2W5H8M5_9SPHI|nr:MAG: hypothetical protein DI598_06280 [Pseudopedobacter saltans]
MADEIINKIAQSGIITIDLETFYPKEEITVIDLTDFLFMGQILKEKHFREQLSNIDWSLYQDKMVVITLSTDTLIPHWAYMLLSSLLEPFASVIHIGTKDSFIEKTILSNISEQIAPEKYTDARIVVKGCGDKTIPASAYGLITYMLRPTAKSIMYGEPCSTVPVYKKKA